MQIHDVWLVLALLLGLVVAREIGFDACPANSRDRRVGSSSLMQDITASTSAHKRAKVREIDPGAFKAMASEPLKIEDLQKALNITFRDGAHKERLFELEQIFKIMSTGLPKNAAGNFDNTIARYALHRLFLKQHRWFITGLDAGSTPEGALSVLKQWVPPTLLHLLEDHPDKQGVNAYELAVLAATLEDLIHREANIRIDKIFDVLGFPDSNSLSGHEASQIMDMYVIIFAINGNITIRNSRQALSGIAKVKANLPNEWHAFEEHLIKPAFAETLWSSSNYGKNENPPVPVDLSGVKLDLDAVKHLAELIGQKFGPFNDDDCETVKHELTKIEGSQPGRVPLQNFYQKGAASNGMWEFQESTAYLRKLGALDESNASMPQVIIPNYLEAAPNCRLKANYYSICCSNQCEDLMGHLEQEISAPMAEPIKVIEVVTSYSAKTTMDDVGVSSTLLHKRLHDMAKFYEGQIPLHSHDFAEWLHKVFPRDCPLPHEKGTVGAQIADEWLEAMGHHNAVASSEELLQWI